jgi:ABC-type nickel/cobalt efflux system permease component RcnA
VLGLDDVIAGLSGGGLAMALIVAFLLGLRHATDPDHLTAVTTLVLSETRYGGRRAATLGLCWGLGHAATLFAFGLPIVLFGRELPEPIQRGAEAAIGIVIVTLAVRLLVRWRRGYFHAHRHRHGEIEHSHPHVHEHAPGTAHPELHEHGHLDSLGRSPRAAFGVGLVHGVGGSAAFGALLAGAAGGPARATIALLVFAAATAISMALVSSFLGGALARGPVVRRVTSALPALGALGVLSGVWYGVGAL